jgi:hypothetical protein
VNSFGFRRCAEKRGNVPQAFLFGFLGERQVLLAGLAFSGKC